MILALAALLSLPLGLVLLVLGLRGVAVDDHPLCRKCGFDLTGKPESPPRCPECGADLSQTKSIRIGHRKRRMKTLVTGIFLALLTLGGGGWIITIQVLGAGWRTYAPVWWLTRETADSNGIVRDAALNELCTRLANSQLSDAQTDRLVEQGLAFQQDFSKRWDPLWGNFIERADRGKKLSPAQWQRYCQHAIQIDLTVRPRIAKDEALPVLVHYLPLRVSAASSLVAIVYQRQGKLKTSPVLFKDAIGRFVSPGGASADSSFIDPEAFSQRAPGPQTIELPFGAIMRSSSSRADLVLDPINVTVPLTILPAGQVSAKLTSDPSLREKVEQSISLPLGVNPDNSTIEILVNQPPTGVAFDALIRINNREMLLGSLALPAGETVRVSLRNPTFLHPGDEQAQIILRPSLDAATKTLDVFEVYNAEFTLHPTASPADTKKPK